MAELAISNVVSISVSQTPTAVSEYNPSNLALFTDETPDPVFDDAYKLYKEPTEVGDDFGTGSNTYKMALAAFSQAPNMLANNGYLCVIPLEGSETLDGAVTRTNSLVQYNGVMASWIELETECLDTAAVVQALNKIYFYVSKTASDLDPTTGLLDKIRLASDWKTRGLFYGSSTEIDAVCFKAAYAGRALSTIFAGSNTTSTMHLKTLSTILPDDSLDQTKYEKALACGADVYASIEGSPGVLCAGTNKFFDQVYNLGWLVGALQIAGFNYLRQASTKIPQTENGMDGLKGAYRRVCDQAVSNQYVAPGLWTSPTTFGNQADLFENIKQLGYYIYSTPVAQQSQADREDRKAPLVQIAIKEAGAVQSSTVIVNVNA